VTGEIVAPVTRSRLVRYVKTFSEHRYGRWVLAAIAFADSSFLPIPPDLLLVPMALVRPKQIWALSLICTVASSLGAIFGYLIGYGLWSLVGVPLVELYGYGNGFTAYQHLIEKWGVWIIIAKSLTPRPVQDYSDRRGGCGHEPSARRQARRLPPSARGPRAGTTCACRRLPRALPAANRPFTRPLSGLRRPHDRNRRHPPCQHCRRCGSLEHLMIPMRDPSEPSVLDRRQLSTPSLRYRFQRPATANRSSEPRRSPAPLIDIRPMAATNIPIAAHWSLDSNRHRHRASTTGRAQSP
jgi:membrane protein YqaA with SNARE-associated domain